MTESTDSLDDKALIETVYKQQIPVWKEAGQKTRPDLLIIMNWPTLTEMWAHDDPRLEKLYIDTSRANIMHDLRLDDEDPRTVLGFRDNEESRQIIRTYDSLFKLNAVWKRTPKKTTIKEIPFRQEDLDDLALIQSVYEERDLDWKHQGVTERPELFAVCSWFSLWESRGGYLMADGTDSYSFICFADKLAHHRSDPRQVFGFLDNEEGRQAIAEIDSALGLRHVWRRDPETGAFDLMPFRKNEKVTLKNSHKILPQVLKN